MLNFDILDNLDPGSPKDFFPAALEEFEARWHVTVTVHDHRGLLYGPDGRSLLWGRDHHGHPLCELQRYSRKEWDRNCLRECGFLTESEALHRLRPFRQCCWKGIAELVVPVERNHQAVLLFYAGPFRGNAAMEENLPEEYRSAWAELVVLELSTAEEMARELLLMGEGILSFLERSRRSEETLESRKLLVRRFIDDHVHETVSLEDLAERMNLSPSRTSHLVRKFFGYSFQELVMIERMTRARNLLLSTEYPLKTIALATGFSNEFYFSRCFRDFYGMPPGEYRRKNPLRRCGGVPSEPPDEKGEVAGETSV